jgi:hypothetical protein
MVSRPLESPRKSAYEPFHLYCNLCGVFPPPTYYSRVYGPEIGDMDEGIVEGREDSCDSEDEFTWWVGQF